MLPLFKLLKVWLILTHFLYLFCYITCFLIKDSCILCCWHALDTWESISAFHESKFSLLTLGSKFSTEFRASTVLLVLCIHPLLCCGRLIELNWRSYLLPFLYLFYNTVYPFFYYFVLYLSCQALICCVCFQLHSQTRSSPRSPPLSRPSFSLPHSHHHHHPTHSRSVSDIPPPLPARNRPLVTQSSAPNISTSSSSVSLASAPPLPPRLTQLERVGEGGLAQSLENIHKVQCLSHVSCSSHHWMWGTASFLSVYPCYCLLW